MRHKRNFLKRAGLNPHVHTKIQLKKMTKTGLIRLVMKLEKFIVSHAYEMYKAKLPRLRRTKRKVPLPILPPIRVDEKSKTWRYEKMDKSNLKLKKYHETKRKTKRKKLTGAAKRKFLARMNKGRRKKGLKPIRSR